MKKLFSTLALLIFSVVVFAQTVPSESYFNEKDFTQNNITCEFPAGASNTTQALCTQNCESARMVKFSTNQQNKTVLFGDGKSGTWSYTTGKLTLTYQVSSSSVSIVFTDVKIVNGKLVMKSPGTNGIICVFNYNVYDPNVIKANPSNFTQPKPKLK